MVFWCLQGVCKWKIGLKWGNILKLLFWNNINANLKKFPNPVNIYLFQDKNRNAWKSWKIYPKLSIKTRLYCERRTLGSDDLIIFKCFRVIFPLKKKTIQCPLLFNLYFQHTKKTPKVVSLPLTQESLCLSFWQNRTNGFSNFQSYHEIVTYLFNSLT